VASGAKKSTLRNTHIAPDLDLVEVQQPATFAQPHIIANREFPWESYFDLWFYGDIFPDVCAEDAQDKALQPRQAERTQTKQQQADKQPNKLARTPSSALEIAWRIG